MLPAAIDIEGLLNPAQAEALQRIAGSVGEAYAGDKTITAGETSRIVAQIAEDGVSDAEMAAAKLLLHYARDYVPLLQGRCSQARADEARLRAAAHESPAACKAWRQAKEALDTLEASLAEAEAVSRAYSVIVDGLDPIYAEQHR